MPSAKRKFAEIEKERAKIRKTNHSISSFFGAKERVTQSNEPIITAQSTDSNNETNSKLPETSPIRENQSSTSSTEVTSARKMVKGKHKVGFDQKWTENRPWLFVEKSDNGQTNAMFCKLCQKHKSRGMNGSVTWTEKGCVTIRKDKVTDHENSEMHKLSLRLETEEQLGIHSAFSEKCLPMGEKEFEAVTCATKILHFLIKHNIPHTTVFKDFINFATTELKCPALQHLEKGKNAMYTSNTVVNELVNCMVDDIESTLKDRVERSPGYAVMTDETTDVTNDKHLAFCVKYVDVDSGDVCVDYIKDVKVDDGKAETIFCETKSVIEELNVDNFVAFGSDGCNTMIGKKTGVAKK